MPRRGRKEREAWGRSTSILDRYRDQKNEGRSPYFFKERCSFIPYGKYRMFYRCAAVHCKINCENEINQANKL